MNASNLLKLLSVLMILPLLSGCKMNDFISQMTIQPEPLPLCELHEGDLLCGSKECVPYGEEDSYCGEQICEIGDFQPDILCQEKPEGDKKIEAGGGNPGGTTVRRQKKKSFSAGTEKCSVGLKARVGLRRSKKGAKTRLSHNLVHGFSEIVIPKGYDGHWVTFEPDPDKITPEEGIFSATWRTPTKVWTASSGDNRGNVVKKFKKARKKWKGVSGTPPEIQDHSITASWTPKGKPTCTPPISHNFKVIFAGDTYRIPPLGLGDFYKRHQDKNFVDPKGKRTGTRVFYDKDPVPQARPKSVHVPIGFYWDIGPTCCNINPVQPEVIQFARAAIDGPNGNMAKPWTLDTLDSEQKKKPKHDPTYTGHPKSDKDETPKNRGAGGKRKIGNDLAQWDAPGMPNSLYHRLLHAEGPSNFRQQFLSLLVCRPKKGDNVHEADFYLDNARVQQYAITTITWEFQGQRGIDRRDPDNLRIPKISVKFHAQSADCTKSLRSILTKNKLLDSYQNPEEKRRHLKILPEETYREVLRDVYSWKTSPKDKLKMP